MSYAAKIDQLRTICGKRLLPLIGQECILADAPYYDNIGDILIWQGVHDFLNENHINCRHEYSIGTFDFPPIPKEVTILLTGGGNFGDLWRFFQDFRLKVIESYPDNPIVMFPQSVWYDDETLMEKDAAAMAHHKNLTLCARDAFTHEIFKKHFSANNIVLVPDMAFCISEKQLSPYRRMSIPGKNLYFKRTDKELCNTTVIETPDFSDIRDWPSMEKEMTRFKLFKVSRGVRRRLPGKFLRRISGNAIDFTAKALIRNALVKTGCSFLAPYEHVTTTRLHAMILSVLLHKQVSYIDNTTGKLSAFADTWLTDLDGITPYNPK